jgi:hypothetical protein
LGGPSSTGGDLRDALDDEAERILGRTHAVQDLTFDTPSASATVAESGDRRRHTAGW